MDLSKVGVLRQYRTAESEGYFLRLEEEPLARVELHFGLESTYGTLILLRDLAEEEILDLIDMIDEQIVVSAETTREDFYVSVFRGEEVGFYSDDHLEEHRQRKRGGGNGRE